jgi:hypothetical protein
MESVVEKLCPLVVDAGSPVEPGSVTIEHCKLHYRNGLLVGADIFKPDEPTLLKLLCRKAYLEVADRLYMIAEPQKMEDTVFVRLLTAAVIRAAGC